MLTSSLMPNIRIGSDTRVGPAPSDVETRQVTRSIRQVEGDNSMGSIRYFRGSLDMASTPSRHGHSRAHSSSVDFSSSPDFNGALASTPHAHVRRRIKHKTSFSLPTINPADFEDVRRSFDDCGRTPPRHLVARTTSGDMGIDLPPIPASYVVHNLSRVTEEEEGNESSLMRETMNDMGRAILALSSSPARPLHPTADTSDSARSDLADLAPIILHGQNLSASFSSSLRSEEGLMAEEMEHVMAMDTPTRTEFVISPRPSSYAGSLEPRDCRGSLRTVHSTASLDMAPSVPDTARTPSGWTTTTGDSTAATIDQFTDADETNPPFPAVDVSLSLSELNVPTHGLSTAISMPTFAHPHPPPLVHSSSIPNFSRPGAAAHAPILSAHPPVPIHDLKSLRARPSNDTIRSEDATHTTMTTDPSPPRPSEEFRPSRQELLRVQQLKERRAVAAATMRSQSAMGHRETEELHQKDLQAKPKNELRPLQLVEKNKGDNRRSMPLPATPKQLTVLKEVDQSANHTGSSENTAEVLGQTNKGSGGDRGKNSKVSLASTGSGKENGRPGKSSKMSHGSAGPRGLRA